MDRVHQAASEKSVTKVDLLKAGKIVKRKDLSNFAVVKL